MDQDKGFERQICEILHTGATLEAACEALKIPQSELRQWIKSNPTVTCEAAKANIDAEIAYLETIQKASEKGDWRAAAWWLERRGHGFSTKVESGKEKGSDDRQVLVKIIKQGRVSPKRRRTAEKKSAGS